MLYTAAGISIGLVSGQSMRVVVEKAASLENGRITKSLVVTYTRMDETIIAIYD